LAKRKRRSIQDYLRLKISPISLEINSSAKRIKELTKGTGENQRADSGQGEQRFLLVVNFILGDFQVQVIS
jgi:hypothetical protein